MCKFLHIRPFDLEADLVVNKGGATVAYEQDGDTVRYAVAHCSVRDNFCRKTGRTLAAGRLKSDRLSTTLELHGVGVEEALRNLVQVQ